MNRSISYKWNSTSNQWNSNNNRGLQKSRRIVVDSLAENKKFKIFSFLALITQSIGVGERNDSNKSLLFFRVEHGATLKERGSHIKKWDWPHCWQYTHIGQETYSIVYLPPEIHWTRINQLSIRAAVFKIWEGGSLKKKKYPVWILFLDEGDGIVGVI
jgi:hypothetical protein